MLPPEALKKVLAGFLAVMQISAMGIMSASAAPSTLSGSDFDSQNITKPTSATATLVSTGIYVKGLNGNAVSDTDTTKWASKTVAQVDDPVSSNGYDRALRFTLNENTQSGNWEIYKSNPSYVSGQVQVYEFSIMLDGKFNNKVWGLNARNSSNKYSQKKFIQFCDGVGTAFGKVQIKDMDNANNLKTLEYNQWYNIKTVLDYTTDGSETATIYINGEMFKTVSIASYLDSYPTFVQAALFVYNSDKGNSERHMYIDDWKYYVAEEESSFEISDYNGAYFMNGAKVDLKTDYYLGSDMEYLDLEKVEYYDNGVKIGESTVAPYDISYVPETAGLHNVTAKGFIGAVGGDDPIVESSTSFVVEQSFTETVVMSEDFEDYTESTEWDSNGETAGSWKVHAGAVPATVDAEYGTSLQMPGTSGQLIRAQSLDIQSGTVKISGEFKNLEGNSNVMYVLGNGGVSSSDKRQLQLNATKKLLDYQNDSTEIASIYTHKWHKIDIITTIKDSKGYYTVYLDGKRVAQRAYNNDSALDKLVKVDYLGAYNTSKPYVDNLSISVIEYNNDTIFTSNGVKVENTEEMGTQLLKAETPCAISLENKQFMAVYDAQNRLVEVKEGVFNEQTGKFEDECELAGEGSYAKVLVWDNLNPSCDEAIIR